MRLSTSTLETKKATSITNWQYLTLAVPLIISGISTPILGAVDTAVIGRIPNPASIGGVAIGAVIFNTMYWLLGFLRVGTSGFTAQAEGANDQKEVFLCLFRPAIIAILFGVLFILLQKPILQISLFLFGGSEAVKSFAADYFLIRIWGAPFILLNYVIIGWLMGRSKVKLSLAIQILMNLLNISLDLLFVLVFGMGVDGVAFATVIAEISAVIFGFALIIRTTTFKVNDFKFKMLLESKSLIRMLRVNRDIFFRTICLLTMTGLFTAKGASMGEVTLAANAVLLQIHYIMAYLFGGFANASGILVGKSIGARDRYLYKRALSLSAGWGLGSAILLALTIIVVGDQIVGFFTTLPEVKDIALELLVWMVVFPIVGFWGLQLEGIFFGATEAKYIRDSIVLSLLVFLAALWLLVPIYHNTGVWVAFILFSLSRSFFLTLFVPKLTKANFS
ncbi:MATE family efflux transporter [Neobacillus sp. NPDC093182]|uniref:MATE family efflux transporter n=1 Tax=Neobacillus sp. NPDC093182 TaxID=3364297 RepID=UPI003802F718